MLDTPSTDNTHLSPPCQVFSRHHGRIVQMPPSHPVKSMFPERLAARREELELTQKEVGERVGKSNSAVSKWEEGSREPDYTTLIRLAAVLHVSVEWLIGTDGAPSPPRPHLRLEEGKRLIRSAREIVEALVSLLPDGDEQDEWMKQLAEEAAPDAPRRSGGQSPLRPASRRRGRP